SCGAFLIVSTSVVPATAQLRVDQTNLVSDISGLAKLTDPDLVNAWGISFGPTFPFWISDNGAGLATLYSVPGSGPPSVSKVGLTVTLPPTAGGITSAPTGQVFNGGVGFGGAVFLFDSEDGVISGWSGGTSAVRHEDFGPAAVYKGLAISDPGTNGAVLYATNFRAGTIEAYDPSFAAPVSVTGNFTDPNLPNGYAPFNDKVINGQLYVTYALQDSMKHDDVAGAGHGFVDVFNLDGTLDKRLISMGALDSPWGLQIAPASFGSFADDLLVGNFGNGMINAYNPTTGAFVGTLDGSDGSPLVIDGLWGLTVGNGSAAGGSLDTLFFTAGPNGESDGLFGSLAVPEPSTWAMLGLGFIGLGWLGLRRSRWPQAARPAL
ncbi:MAG TPA: TIGR03118 family protein, partial [Roseiarcus sp.]|nr:TIGR03118 family protein [Roseiarcus sp.]